MIERRPKRVHVIQGECHVTDERDTVLTTVLGSCIAACMRDPVLGIGGMNHFLLPGEAGSQKDDERFGVYLMELLVNGLLKRGASRHSLETKLFGGARTVQGFADIGAKNFEFARRFLENESIRYVGGSVGGDQGRKLEYQPSTGRARQFLLPRSTVEPVLPVIRRPAPAEVGNVELF